jgi:hypothetical protein
MKRTPNFDLLLAAICLAAVARAALEVFGRHDLIGFGDWFGLWSVPVIARSANVASIYDMQSLAAAQTALGLGGDFRFPFPYPPTFLAILWPLGSMSMGVAFAAFMAASFAVYLVASSDRWRAVPFLALNPGAVANFAAGQSGFLSAGLMLGATRILTKHPLAAGALFGLLTYKPQLGIMVPVALLAARQWKCIATATITTALIIAATSWCFGVGAWVASWQSLGDYARVMEAVMPLNNLHSPTVWGMLRGLGVGYNVAGSCQMVSAIVSAAAVWMSWRQFDPRTPQPAILALCAATFLATPHALWYDLTMLNGALVLYATSRLESLRFWERSLIMLGIVLPAVSTRVAIADPVVLAAILWMACTTSARRASALEDAIPNLDASTKLAT